MNKNRNFMNFFSFIREFLVIVVLTFLFRIDKFHFVSISGGLISGLEIQF